ncbi:peptidase S9, prolyl oligopeptidase, partial [Rhodotorula toruloides]
MSRATPTLTIAFKEVNGHKVHLDCHLPPAEHVNESVKPVPVVVWIHGGGFFDGACSDWSDVNLHATLSRGWAFVALDYRLVPQVTLEDAVQDIRDGCEFVRSGKLDEALGGRKVDGGRLAVSGSSAGGALAVFAAYTLSPPRECAIRCHIPYDEVSSHLDRNGPVVSHSPAEVNFATMEAFNRTRACFYAIQEGKVLPWSTRVSEPIDFSNPPAELKRYVGTALVKNAKEPKKEHIPPTVCVHGSDDLMVPFALSEELVKVLKDAGVDAALIEEKGANHGFDLIPGVYGDATKMQVFEKANDFIAKYILKRPFTSGGY